jgi:hypothetical protein
MDPCDQAELEREIAEPRHLLPEHLRRGVMIVVVSDEKGLYFSNTRRG